MTYENLTVRFSAGNLEKRTFSRKHIVSTPTAPTAITLTEMSVIVFRPHDNVPEILLLRADGITMVHHFGNDADCDECWVAIEENIKNDDFLRYYSMFFRAEELQSLDKRRSTDLAHYLHFVFHNGFEFLQQYNDQQQLNADLQSLTDILATLQDIRASRYPPETKQ